MIRLRTTHLFFILCIACRASAQTFDLEQFEQVFRPRLRFDARFQPDVAYRDTSGRFSLAEATAVFTVPVRSRFKLGFEADSSAQGIGDFLNKSVRVRASQVLATARFTGREVQLGLDSIGARRLMAASAGLMGVKLTRKRRLLFWSANVNLSEEDRTFDVAVLRGNGVIGKLHVKGLRRQFFYGLAISYSDRFVVPLPFLGGEAPLGGKWSLHYVVPAQLALGYRPRSGTRFLAGFAGDGFRSGLEWQGERVNMNHAAFRAFVNLRHRVNRTIQIRADAGYAITQGLRFTGSDSDRTRYPITPGFSFGLGVNVLFGNSVAQRLLDEVLK